MDKGFEGVRWNSKAPVRGQPAAVLLDGQVALDGLAEARSLHKEATAPQPVSRLQQHQAAGQLGSMLPHLPIDGAQGVGGKLPWHRFKLGGERVVPAVEEAE